MQNSTEERVYAGFFVRLAAYLIDWIIVGAALLIIRIPAWIASFSGGGGILTRDFIFQYSVFDILIYLLKLTYFVLLTFYTGSTLGKKLMNIAVESEEDRKPTFFEIVYRESVGKFLSGVILSIGYLIIGIDKKKRGLHDHLADTCVVYRHKKVIYVAAPVMVQNTPFISTQMTGQNRGQSFEQTPAGYSAGESEKRIPYQQMFQESAGPSSDQTTWQTGEQTSGQATWQTGEQTSSQTAWQSDERDENENNF